MKRKWGQRAALCCAALLLLAGCAEDRPKTEQAGPAYFLVHDIFVGSLEENGTWKSASNTRLNFEAGAPFSVGELFGCKSYFWYTQDGRREKAESIRVFLGEGPGGFDVSCAAQLAPYALKMEEYDVGRFAIPTELKEADYDIEAPSYGFAMFTTEDEGCTFATSSERDMRPKAQEWRGAEYDTPVTQAETDAVQSVLAQNGIASNAAISSVCLDYDGDGQDESFVFAATPRDEDGYLVISPESGGAFSIVLLLDGEETQTVYSKIEPYTDDVTAMFVQIPAGVFDLDGDGVFEVCMTEGYWESSYHFVLREQNGGWEIVLAGAAGM